MSIYRPEFEDALRLFARASSLVTAQGYTAPVLVGGGAVELYTNGAINTGDFDIVAPRQDIFEDALQQCGFVRPSGAGVATRGWVHEGLRLGFEVVSSTLLDGQADRDRVRLLDLADDGQVAVIALEDMIADRMGQFASGTAPDMLAQAQALFDLYPDADFDYMERRIRYETAGELGVETLRR